MKIYLVFLLLLAGAFSARAQSADSETDSTKAAQEKLYALVLAQLQLEEDSVNTELVAAKKLPYSDSLMVMVLPKIANQEVTQWGNGAVTYDAYVVLVNLFTGTINSIFFEAEAWVSDAVMLQDITIDTAPYRINGQNRAFGIRVSYRTGSQPNPYSRTDFSLFMQSDSSLVRILKNLELSSFSGEWDTRCRGEFEEMESVLMVGKEKTKGFQNLGVKQTFIQKNPYKVGDDCKERNKVSSKTITLRYNGKEYEVPARN